MKQLFCLFVLVACCGLSPAVADDLDSLRHRAEITTDPAQQVKIYRDLADAYLGESEEAGYLRALYRAAQRLNDSEQMFSALSDLTLVFAWRLEIDSVYHYMELIREKAAPKDETRYLSLIRMTLFDTRLAKVQTASEGLEYELDVLKNADKNDIYIQIEQAYVTGSGLFDNKLYEEAAPHLETAYELANKLPDTEDNYKYRIITGWIYANNFGNIGSWERCVELVEEVLNLHKSRYEKYYAEQRPYFQINRDYLHCYASLFIRISVLPQAKIDYYLAEIQKLAPKISQSFDRYNYYLAMDNYYLHYEDYEHVLIANDSLLKVAEVLVPMNVPSLLNYRSKVYEVKGDYQRALETHRKYVQLKDSIAFQETQKQLNTLQVEYEVDRLTFEKTTLENRTRLILLVSIALIFLAACIYLYYHLKRERQIKDQLFQLNQRAEESEKMKTAFVNSMCHEIRTPLNAILGFTGVIVSDDSLDIASRKEFYGLIEENTDILTALIDHLLMVSNLDANSEELPCEETNLTSLCNLAFEKAVGRAKPTIKYRFTHPDEEVLVQTNPQYLALVVGNMLHNAAKFTKEGSVTMELARDEAAGKVCILITDTGCGIPVDKQEVVFERFVKLDPFVQGNGLGLYMCRLIMTRLKGSIHIDPAYTGGARFVIELPL